MESRRVVGSRGWGLGLVLVSFLGASPSSATVLVPPANLAQELLSETIPTAVAPFEADAARDFRVHWETSAPAGVSVELVPGSLQWVRASEVLVAPRGRIRVKGLTGILRQSGVALALAGAAEGGVDGVEVEVALLSDPDYAIELGAGGKTHRLRLLYTGRSRGWFVDASCSPFSIQIKPAGRTLEPAGWGYVGCRRVATFSTESKKPSLTTWWVWNPSDAAAKAELKLNGEKLDPISPGIWGIRYESDAREARIEASGEEFATTAWVAPKLNFGSMGVGIGPYLYRYSGLGDGANRVAPLLTLYGSYILTDTLRLVAFGAAPIAPQAFMDAGFYVNTEYFTALDRRLSVRLMLGFHAIGFKTNNSYVGAFGLPQGIEAIYFDFLKRGYNLGVGGFIYPEISGKSYYNLWLRWGTWRFFAELNYIAWKETPENDHAYFSRSAGVSVGFPLLGFW